MIYDVETKDPPSLDLIAALYDAATETDIQLRAQAKFMRRCARRYPQLQEYDVIPQRIDGATYLSAAKMETTRDFLQINVMGAARMLEKAPSLKQQETDLCSFLRIAFDEVSVRGLPLEQFFALVNCFKKSQNLHGNPGDRRVALAKQHVTRYADNLVASVMCLEELMQETYGKHLAGYCPGTPYQLALQQWHIKHPRGVLNPSDNVQVQNEAITILDELFSPYHETLPEGFHGDVLGVIGKARHGVSKHVVANDDTCKTATILRLPFAQQRVKQILHKAFEKHPNVVNDHEMILDALSFVTNATRPQALRATAR